MRTLVLLVGVCSALPQYPDERFPDERFPQQQQLKCASNQHCVPPFLCVDGYINTEGAGLMFALFLQIGKCTDPDNSSFQTICCNIPEVPEPSLATCADNEVCLPSYLCNADGNVNINRSGRIATRSGISKQCNVEQTSEVGICCNPPASAAPRETTAITPAYPIAGQCGVRNVEPVHDRRIQSNVTNKESQFGEFPWQGFIFIGNCTFKCGASVIGHKWVVTAAHCVKGFKPHDIKVRLGEWEVNGFEEPKPYVDVDVAAITIHPKFNPNNVHNDIAVLELVRHVAFQYHINSICLPSPGQTFWGQRCIATGWGKDTFEGQYQYILKKVELPTVEHHQCQNLLQNTPELGRHFLLDDSLMCAGGEGHKDVCEGDGGGPLACQDPVTGRYVLTGITSFGVGRCGTESIPGVYADVQALLPFVQLVELETFPAAGKCGMRNLKPVLDQSNVEYNEAYFGEFPWQGIILYKNSRFKCGASLIGDRWLVTAAHCVNGFTPYDIMIRLGEWQLKSFDEPMNYVDVNVAAITIHPQFNPNNVHNGIAVIQLIVPLAFQYHISPICLPSPGQTFWGQRCIATGWGKDALDGQYQYIMKKVEMPTVEHDHCQSQLRKTAFGEYFKLDDSFMCAGGEENNDACEGDGGGPLACQDPVTGQYVLTGITAFGAGPCGTKDVPGVYADVQALLPFVWAVVNGNYDPNSFQGTVRF